MSGSDYDQLLKAAASRPLTPPEQQQLEQLFLQHEGARAEWDLDLLIETRLQRMPVPALSSNFTTQVLAAVSAPNVKPRRSWDTWRFLFRPQWSPALLTLLVVGFLLVQHQRQNALRADVARSVETFSTVASLLAKNPPRTRTIPAPEMPPMPNFDVFENFDAIRRLDLVPQQVDMELLIALQ